MPFLPAKPKFQPNYLVPSFLDSAAAGALLLVAAELWLQLVLEAVQLVLAAVQLVLAAGAVETVDTLAAEPPLADVEVVPPPTAVLLAQQAWGAADLEPVQCEAGD